MISRFQNLFRPTSEKAENEREDIENREQWEQIQQYHEQIRRTILRFLLWAHNDACHLQSLLLQDAINKNAHAHLTRDIAYEINELVYARLSIPMFVLARQLTKNVLSLRSVLQQRISMLYSRHALALNV